MNTSDIDTRIGLIDDALAKLRCRLTGSSTPCLPPETHTTRAEQIAHITSVAAQITYCYAAVNVDSPPDELRTCRTLTCACLAYLLIDCNQADQTYGNLLLLLRIDRGTLLTMLSAAPSHPHRLRHFIRNGITALCKGTALTADLEQALLLYLQQNRLLPSTDALRQQLCALSM